MYPSLDEHYLSKRADKFLDVSSSLRASLTAILTTTGSSRHFQLKKKKTKHEGVSIPTRRLCPGSQQEDMNDPATGKRYPI